MVSSACAVLLAESERFIIYLLADKRLKSSIVDKDSFMKAVELAFKSDPSLKDIFREMRRRGDNIENCLNPMFKSPEVKKIIDQNLKGRRTEIRKKVKKQRPTLRGKKLTAEINRRLKISVGVSKAKQGNLKQITIDEATKPIFVKANIRGKKVSYRKTKYKKLSSVEERLILNNIKRGKKPKAVVDVFQKSMGFRTETSIKKHYYRIKKKYEEGTLSAMGTVKTSL